MSIVEHNSAYTIDDLLAMPDQRNFELIHGQLEEVNVSSLSSCVAVNVASCLNAHVLPNGLGIVFRADAYYQCFPDDPHHARKPDVSFVSQARLPADWQSQGYFRLAPDLVVKVISLHDEIGAFEEKLQEYLHAGVRIVWEIRAEQRVVYIHRINGTVEKLHENDLLSGEDVVPGFSCRVGELFPPAIAS